MLATIINTDIDFLLDIIVIMKNLDLHFSSGCNHARFLINYSEIFLSFCWPLVSFMSTFADLFLILKKYNIHKSSVFIV